MKLYLILLLQLLFVLLKSQSSSFYFLNSKVDQVPENYGGKEGLKQLLNEQLIYPEEDLKKKIEGTVRINFICDEKGLIKKQYISSGVSENIDKEAIRLFKLLLWHPALKDGKALEFEYYIELKFSTNNYKKAVKRRTKLTTNIDNLPSDTSFVIYEKPNKNPFYFYGKDSLQNYIASELEYPQEAKTKNIEGTVVLSFIVETNGTITNIFTEKPLGGGCQGEAIRVMSNTIWVPAQNNKLNVRCRVYYSVVFKLSSSFKDNSQGSQRVGGY